MQGKRLKRPTTCPLFFSLLKNCSQFRQIPDNQEVFVDMSTQQSLIFELLEQVEASNEEVARYFNRISVKYCLHTENDVYRYHFQQLADDNDAATSSVTVIDNLKPQDVTPLLP